MNNEKKIQLLRNGIRGALYSFQGNTDHIFACSGEFARVLGRDATREARDAQINAMSRDDRYAFFKNFPCGHNLYNRTNGNTALSLESTYSDRSVAMALSVVALKEGMEAHALLNTYTGVLKSFRDAASLNSMRERFPELETAHIDHLVDALTFEESIASLRRNIQKVTQLKP
jgi:hypothetical protein